MPKAIATLDPMVAIFMVGTFGIVALASMAFGYDAEFRIAESGVLLTKRIGAEDAHGRFVAASYE